MSKITLQEKKGYIIERKSDRALFSGKWPSEGFRTNRELKGNVAIRIFLNKRQALDVIKNRDYDHEDDGQHNYRHIPYEDSYYDEHYNIKKVKVVTYLEEVND